MLGGMKLSFRMEDREQMEVYQALGRRYAHVLSVVRGHGELRGRETLYRDLLALHLSRQLSTTVKPELPLLSGTRVDLELEYESDDWYITIKRQLNNQRRLVLQGEIDDILRHAPIRGRNLWIVVVVGVISDANELAHLRTLREFADERSFKANRNRSGRAFVCVCPILRAGESADSLVLDR